MESLIEDDDLSKIFENACDFVRSISGQLSAEKLLYFYARFKQVNEGPCNSPKPGFFDFQGKQKWDAWKKLGDKPKEKAMVEYIEELQNIDHQWEEKLSSGAVKKSSGLGVGVSTLKASDADVIPDSDKTVFDWCIEDDVTMVTKLIRAGVADINGKDSEGRSLLHWASDRGHTDMVGALLKFGADINVQDADEQTPLHYAVCCEHIPVIKDLLSNGADLNIVDCDGQTSLDVADSDNIKEILLGNTR